MKALLLPIILMLLGTGAGVGAGIFLAPPPEEEKPAAASAEAGDTGEDAASAPAARPPVPEETEFAKLNNQFIIPVVNEGSVSALVVMSLSLEVVAGTRAAVYATEPKLRDRFLRVMFDHANTGGFSGNFTSGPNLRALRNSLMAAAQEVAGDSVTDVLVIDIVRQDN